MHARHLALPLLALALSLIFIIGGGYLSPHIALFRAHATAWTAALLTTPALALFLARAGAKPLGQAWRLWWTGGWLLIFIHLWWGLGLLHAWDAPSVFHRQGFLIAAPIFFLEAIWIIDIVLAWTHRGWAQARGWLLAWQWFAWLVTAANFFVSLVIFRNDLPSLVIGTLMTAVLIVVALRRLAGGALWVRA